MSGKRSELQRAIDAIDGKIEALQGAKAELLAVQGDKPATAKRARKAKPPTTQRPIGEV